MLKLDNEKDRFEQATTRKDQEEIRCKIEALQHALSRYKDCITKYKED